MECIFCKIANKEIGAEIVYEDDNFLAFLDINPRSTGMTLVITKTHLKNLTDDENISKEIFALAIKIAEALKNGLNAIAVSIAYMPSQIEHLHLRIYPYFENEIPLIENKPRECKKEELKSIGEIVRKNLKIEKVEKIKVENRREEKIEEKISSERENLILSRKKRDWLIP